MSIDESQLPVIDINDLPPDQILDPLSTSYGFATSSFNEDDDDQENMIEDYDLPDDDEEETREELEPDDEDEDGGDFDYDIEDED